jgi:hypothetical protein
MSNSRLDVFVEGTDNHLWERYLTTSWSNWIDLGGVLAAAPAAAAWTYPAPGNEIDAIVKGTDSHIWHKEWDDTTHRWTSFQNLGGAATSDPGAVWWEYNGRLDVFYRDSNEDLYQDYFVGLSWSGWILVSYYPA